MSRVTWLPTQAVPTIRNRKIARFGGASGFRDSGLLQNALQRSVDKWRYESADIFECATGLASVIAKAHAVVDGDK